MVFAKQRIHKFKENGIFSFSVLPQAISPEALGAWVAAKTCAKLIACTKILLLCNGQIFEKQAEVEGQVGQAEG